MGALRVLRAGASDTSLTSVQEPVERVGVPDGTHRSKPDLAQGAQRTSLKEQAEDARSKYRRAEEGLLTRERQPRRLKRSNSERLWGFRNRKLEGKMGHEKLRVSRKEMKGISIKPGGDGG